MAIPLECLSVIIPIATIINHIGLDGFHRHLADNTSHDNYLYRIGAMNPMDVELIINNWQKQGFRPTGRRRGELYWKDLCVVDARGPTLPCNWIEYNPGERIVRLKGKD